ncbi:MAG: DUF2723 domain-containing protein [Elusimicrobia bacterium]|nr:DUF2723 domain-containing protein [Elusimicrobiota bacterium]
MSGPISTASGRGTSSPYGSVALVFLAAFGFFLSGASPSIAPRDSADMASAALTLGVAHPPGYPLYSVLGHLWLTVFPWGNPAYRLAVLSCLAAAGAVFFLFLSVRRRHGVWAGLTGAAVLAFSAPLWKFALIQEKYSVHACFVAVLFYLSEGESGDFWRRARLSGLVAGLGLVNHQSLLFFLPGFLLLWRSECRRFNASLGSVLAAAVPCSLAGLSLYAFLWVRLGSLGAALSVALRSQYGAGTLSAQLARPFTPDGAVRLFAWSLKTWALAVSIPAAAAACAGAFLSWREDRDRAAGLLLAALLSGPLFVVLARFDASNWVARSVLEPAFLVPALAAAVFAGAAVSRLGRLAPAGLALAAAALLLRSPVPERRDDFLAYDYARNLRRAVPPAANLLVSGDTALFGLRWLEAASPREAALELAGAGLTEPRAWLAARTGKSAVFVAGLASGILPSAALTPEGLVQRAAGRPATPAPVVLRRSASWRRDESYARDAKLSYAFAAWSAARLLEARGEPVPEALDLTAVSLDPEDYRLE